MNRLVTVIDYGMGNLLSVAKAFEHCGADVRVSDRYEHVIDADVLVLPGVGAFANAMAELRKNNLDEAIKEFSMKERPFLGICLGMQMMLAYSKEFGQHDGLGLIKGSVDPIEPTDIEGNTHKIPHISWSAITPPRSADQWVGSILDNVDPGTSFYFVHSFTAVPDLGENRFAETYYNGRLISAVIRSGSLFGCQFHPEKSGKEGLKVIKCFLAM